MATLARAENRHTEFLWSILRDLFHYCAFHLEDIADSAREIDLAMRFGYGWQAGPVETWLPAGGKGVANRLEKAFAGGRPAMVAARPGGGPPTEPAPRQTGPGQADA